jgi:hypothetical protein
VNLHSWQKVDDDRGDRALVSRRTRCAYARYPRFKKKALNESFALWNDQFTLSGKQVRIAKLGFVRTREELRFVGKNPARSWRTQCRAP